MNTAVDGTFLSGRRPEVEAHAAPLPLRNPEAIAAAQASANAPAVRVAAEAGTGEPASRAIVFRAALVLGSLAAAVVAWLATVGLAQPTDAELATLLRGMAAIKGLLGIAAAALVWWRLGQPVSVRVAVAYIACIGLLFAGTMLIWQLAFLSVASGLFHVGAFVGVVIAFREGRHAPERAVPRGADAAVRLSSMR